MGHDTHFLERLDRVATGQVEFAMGLYRDPLAVKILLEAVRLPPNAERIALSLDDPVAGPFVLVTREGDFVTCLGRGMSTGPHPVVPRGQVDAIVQKIGSLRARIDENVQRLGEDAGARLYKRLWRDAWRLSREDFIGLVTWQPLLGQQYRDAWAESQTFLMESSRTLLERSKKRLRPIEEPLFQAYGRIVWAHANLTMLISMDSEFSRCAGEAFARHPDALGALSWATLRQDFAPIAMRGFWAVGRAGKPLLPMYKHAYAAAQTPAQVVNGGCGLAAIGQRHSRLRAEVRKALCRPLIPESQNLSLLTNPFIRYLNETLPMILEKDDEGRATFLALGRDIAHHAVETRGRSGRYQYERLEDVPDDIAGACGATATVVSVLNKTGLPYVVKALPWLAEAAPEDLFLPADYVQAYLPPWNADATHFMFTEREDHKYRSLPIERDEPKVGRNEPCPCGSQKKYKRCCGMNR